MNKILTKRIALFLMAVCLIAGCAFLSGVKASAADTSTTAPAAREVSVTEINYDNLTMTVDMGGNSILYYSKDDKTWYEMEGSDMTASTRAEGTKVMDIAWMTTTKDTSIYLKGDKNKRSVEVTIPKQNTALKVKFDKAEGTLEFENEETTVFQWRKSTDYNWNTAPIGESAKTDGATTTMTWAQFLEELEALRIKGGKIVVKTPGKNGVIENGSLNVGVRPSKEVTVTISKRSNAPGTSLNVKKLTLNTTTKQEYSTNNEETWKDCSKTMKLKEVLPQVFEGQDGTIKIRTQATDKAGYSKTLTLVVKGQEAAPTGDMTGGYVEENSKTTKFVIQFPKATKTTPYEYMIVKPGATFDETKTWKSVTKDKVIKLSKTAAPDGSTIYYRKKGIAANKTKGTPAVLPSAYTTITVTFTATDTTTPAPN